MKRLPYREGTWFAVPLRQGGYAVGLVARMAPKGKIILAYFFGPKFSRIPSLAEVLKFTLKDSIKYLKVGDLGLINGEWPVIGDTSPWKRELWPMPEFIRRESPNSVYLITYSDSDPTKVVKEIRILHDAPGVETDSLAGYGAAEIILTKTFDSPCHL